MKRLRAAASAVAAYELWIVAACVAASVLTTRLLPVALGIAAAFWLIRWLAGGRFGTRSLGDWAVCLLAGMVPVTLWITTLPDLTRLAALRLLSGIALYYAVVNWTVTERRVRLLAAGTALVGLTLALSAPVSVEWFAGTKLLFIPDALYRPLPLLVPDPIHPNVMAGTLVVLLPCALGSLLFEWRQLRWPQRGWRGLVVGAMLGVLALTKSRGGLMGLAALAVVLITLRWRRGWLVVLLAALAGSLVVWRAGPARIVEALTATQTLSGLSGRLEVWSRALQMIQDFPLTGIGMGAFKPVVNALYPFFMLIPNADVPHAHNLILQIAVDLGLPGLIAWLALWGLVCVAAWQAYRRGQRASNLWLAGLGAGLLASQAALAVHGLTDAVTWGVRPAVVVWAIWGLAAAAWQLSESVIME